MMQTAPQCAQSIAGTEFYPLKVRVMGIEVRNCLGLAAGIDRTGLLLPSLSAVKAGHIEVGTIIDPRDLRIPGVRQLSDAVIGVNVGSGKPGFSREVLADYRACVAAALPCAAFIVLNFSNQTMLRCFSSVGAKQIVSTARAQIDDNTSRTGRSIALLAKVRAERLIETLGVYPALATMLDGLVIVSERIDCISEVRRLLPQHGIVSVGGAVTADDVRARRHAGADLVQIHRAFTDGGAAQVQRIVRDLEQGFAHG